MQKIFKKISMAALAIAGTIMMGCAENDLVENGSQTNNKTVTLTTTINFNGSNVTRAMTADGKKTFAKDEQIALIYQDAEGGVQKAVATLQESDISSDKKSATLTFSLDKAPKAGGTIAMIYPASMASEPVGSGEFSSGSVVDYSILATQDGTITSIASKLDLAVYDGNLTDQATLPGTITLTNQFAIGEFTLKNEGGDDITSTITKFIITQGPNIYTVNRTAAAGPIYVAMQPDNEVDITFAATTDKLTAGYTKSVTKKTLEASNIYPVSLTMAKMDPQLFIPLTLKATEDGTTITFKNAAAGPVSYQIGEGDLQTIGAGETKAITANAGNEVKFFGDNEAYESEGKCSNINNDKDCYVFGNIMSLISSKGFAALTELTVECTFTELFKSNIHIKNDPTIPLLLPAMTLTNSCYSEMFRDCTGLTSAPALPATTLAKFCYDDMFRGCTGLTSAPALPATTLDEGCYQFMFQGCTGLTSAPALPATTLAKECYQFMFYGCTSLITAPVLPAKTLAYECYKSMFRGCEKLNNVTCLATDISAQDCTTDWLNGVSDSGIFFINSTLIPDDPSFPWSSGVNGIPDNWTVDDAPM